MQQRGLPIKGYVNYSAASDPNHLLGRPWYYVSKLNFHDSRVPREKDFAVSGGGSIETFLNAADARRRLKYVQAIAKSGLFPEYDYLSGKVLLRLSNILTPQQAAQYEQALHAIV
jgi:hypothetical protein